MQKMKSRVYVVVDSENRVIQIEGEYSLSNIKDMSTAILAEEGEPCDRLNHAQTAYLDKPIMTADGVYRYKWDGSAAVLRTEEELETDRAARPAPPPTTDERLATLEDQLVQADETAISLYEAQEAQEAINVQQDEALMEIYEMIG